jgi:hypothetical protein
VYFRQNKVKPKLSLSTQDGALLCGADPISLVLGGVNGVNQELVASVLSYDTPPTSTLFLQAAAKYGIGKYKK